MHALWSIPELLIVIVEGLCPKDLRNAVSVSRSFWQAAAPSIWAVIYLHELGKLFDIASDEFRYQVCPL